MAKNKNENNNTILNIQFQSRLYNKTCINSRDKLKIGSSICYMMV